jgi:hypothetical protein
MDALGESSGESPLLDTPGRNPAVRARRLAQVFKVVINTNPPEFDMLPLCDDASDDARGWFVAAENGTPQTEVEVRVRVLFAKPESPCLLVEDQLIAVAPSRWHPRRVRRTTSGRPRSP